MSILDNLTDKAKETFRYIFEEEVISDEDLIDENPSKHARSGFTNEPKAEKAPVFIRKEEPAEPVKPKLELKTKVPKMQAPKTEESVEQGEESVRKSFLNFRSKNDSKNAEPKEATAAPKSIPLPIENKIINVVILEPVDFNDSQKIADYLRRNQPVVVNFTNTDPVIAKRMSDYISGTIYALNGGMKKLGRTILVCAPKNVDIDAGTNGED